jgi:hypothetical protein
VQGFNDPLSADQPDDLRGIWDQNNKPKPLREFVRQIFSDFDAHVVPRLVGLQESAVSVEIRNRRKYRLTHIQFFRGERQLDGPFDLAAGETKAISFPLTSDDTAVLSLRAEYSTHHGLAATSHIEIHIPRQSSTPVILNDDAVDTGTDSSSVKGRLLRRSDLEIVFPADWHQVELNGQNYSVDDGRQVFHLRPVVEPVTALEFSADGEHWQPLTDPAALGSGPQRVRFKLQRAYPPNALLLLAGLGTEKYWLRYGQGTWKEIPGHRYRENIVELSKLPKATADDYLYLLLPRSMTTFIEKQDHPFGKEVPILFEAPKVFSPVPFEIRKLS